MHTREIYSPSPTRTRRSIGTSASLSTPGATDTVASSYYSSTEDALVLTRSGPSKSVDSRTSKNRRHLYRNAEGQQAYGDGMVTSLISSLGSLWTNPKKDSIRSPSHLNSNAAEGVPLSVVKNRRQQRPNSSFHTMSASNAHAKSSPIQFIRSARTSNSNQRDFSAKKNQQQRLDTTDDIGKNPLSSCPPRYPEYALPSTPSARGQSVFSYSAMSKTQPTTKADKIIDSIADIIGCEFRDDNVDDDDDSRLREKAKAPIVSVSFDADDINCSFESDLTEDSYLYDTLPTDPPELKSKGVFEMIIDTFGGDNKLCIRNQASS